MFASSSLELFLPDLEATRSLGALLGQAVPDCAVIALRGPLGAGKTTLVQGVGLGLGACEIINSPTFTMLNEYHSGRLPLYHLDLYRLTDDAKNESMQEASWLNMLKLELEEFIHGPGITLIEWAECIESFLPPDYLVIELAYAQLDNPDQGRTAKLTAKGKRSVSLIQQVGLG